MSEDAPVVGLVGDGDVFAALREAFDDAGTPCVGGPPAAVLDADPVVVVAVGDSAVAAVAARGPSPPIVPVDAGVGVRAVPRERIDGLPAAVAASSWETEVHVPLTVRVGDEPVATAVFDVALVTAEPARISEYAVIADGKRLDRSRADGVVVATPAGATDYARRIGAPVLAPETGVTVAWIAPFRTDPDRWVVDPSTLEVRVQREEATVDLHVDTGVVRSVGPDDVVTIAPTDPFSVAVLERSQHRYG